MTKNTADVRFIPNPGDNEVIMQVSYDHGGPTITLYLGADKAHEVGKALCLVAASVDPSLPVVVDSGHDNIY